MKLYLLVAFVSLATPVHSNCMSAHAQEVLSYLTEERDIRNYRTVRCSGPSAYIWEDRALANRNRARLSSGLLTGCQNPVSGYQLQIKRKGQWFASDTYLDKWGCSDAKWAPGMIGARCIEVKVCGSR